MLLYEIYATFMATLWGIVCVKMAEKYGKTNQVKWFILGFLFGIFEVLYLVLRYGRNANTNNNNSNNNNYYNNNNNYNTNQYYQQPMQQPVPQMSQQEKNKILLTGGWECEFCHNVIRAGIQTCICGKTRGESQEYMRSQWEKQL